MLIKLAWRNLWRNKLRTGIMLGAILFGLLGVVSMIGFMTGLMDSMLKNAIDWQTSHIQVHHVAYADNPEIKDTIVDFEQLKAKIAADENVAEFSARFLANGMIASARSTRGIQINGINLDQERATTPLADNIKQGEWLSEQGRNPVLVSEKTASRLRLKIGSKVVLTFTNAAGDVAGAAFRVRGIFKTPSTSFDDGNVYVRKADLIKLAGITGAHEIAIVLKDPSSDALAATLVRISQQSNTTNSVQDWRQIQPLLASMAGSMRTSNAIMLGIFVVAMGFGIVNIMLMSVFERTREFGVLMAIGMQKHKIFSLIILESMLLGVSGGVIGILGCVALIGILAKTGIPLGALAEGLGTYGIDTVLYPYVNVADYQMVFVTIVFASVVAAIYPARQILKQRPAQAMSEKH